MLSKKLELWVVALLAFLMVLAIFGVLENQLAEQARLAV